MQEVFEDAVKGFVDIYQDALQHTNVVKLLADLKIQKACADAHAARIKKELDEALGTFDEDYEDSLWTYLIEFKKESETFKYVIDVIESGKFAEERK